MTGKQDGLFEVCTNSQIMFPPIEDTVLQNNPKFAALHKTLTTRILNPNGSTKNDPAQIERDATTEVLPLPFNTVE